MRKTWPWHYLAIGWLVGVLLCGRALIGVRGHRIATLAACVLALQFLFVGIQFVLQARWKREWDQTRDLPSDGARFYYVLGLILKASRRLAPIPDEVQHDARKMADLGLPHQATPEEMTRVAITVMGLFVVTTIVLSLYITYGSYDISSDRMPWWLGIPTLMILALTLLKKVKRS